MLKVNFVASEFGYFKITGTDLGINSIKLIGEKGGIPSDNLPDPLMAAAEQLEAYFDGTLRQFDLPLDFGDHSDFYKKVWAELLKIPFGRTSSYLAIAEQLGDPKSVRAVGMANRNNPIAIVVPCHRVIAKNGNLQGYFYGLDMKRRLLALENPRSFAPQGQLF